MSSAPPSDAVVPISLLLEHGLWHGYIEGTADPAPGIKRCLVYTQYHNMWLFWIPILIYESTTLALVIRKFYGYFKNGSLSPSLVHRVLRDMVLYLTIVFIVYIANAVLFANPDPSLASIMTPVTLVLLSVCGNRMLFDLREEKDRSSRAGLATGDTVGTLRFAMPTQHSVPAREAQGTN
ncbi:hypothetical protein V5O48_005076 [Marasmius crinis-equi]|uniref:Transmembrane protein n=1 Tax=Marasmius crinis-equi TaxID=585013 RepID=A0ABR3FNI3_9AGAR